jgi:hypothetical protein
MKKEAREKAIVLLADRNADIEDASAWILVFACKVCMLAHLLSINPLTVHSHSVCISNIAHVYTLDIHTSTRISPLLEYK